MSRVQAPRVDPAAPLAYVGRSVIGFTGYLGAMAILAGSAARAIVGRDPEAPSFRTATVRQLDWMLGMGLPLVALVHIGMGSFLSMQAYFGGTFADGTGAVVGVGLIRNLAPLMSGLTMAGLIAARVAPELRGGPRPDLDGDPAWVPDRDDVRLGRSVDETPIAPARRAAVRIVAATIAGPIMAFWGAAVGSLVGWQVAQKLIGISTADYFGMFLDMIWSRDVTGLAIKGALFGAIAGLAACHEGLRSPDPEGPPDPNAQANASFRAACLAGVAVLAINSGWFLVFYHASAGFGPTLLAPPSR